MLCRCSNCTETGDGEEEIRKWKFQFKGVFQQIIQKIKKTPYFFYFQIFQKVAKIQKHSLKGIRKTWQKCFFQKKKSTTLVHRLCVVLQFMLTSSHQKLHLLTTTFLTSHLLKIMKNFAKILLHLSGTDYEL